VKIVCTVLGGGGGVEGWKEGGVVCGKRKRSFSVIGVQSVDDLFTDSCPASVIALW